MSTKVEFVRSRWENSEVERFDGVPSEALHLHDRVEVAFADRGPLVIEGQNWRQLVLEGSAYVLGEGLVHRLPERGAGVKLWRMYLGQRALSLLPSALLETSRRQPVLLSRETIQAWWAELNRGWYPARVEAPRASEAPEHPAVVSAVSHLRKNLNRTISLDELGRVCRMSKFHLCRTFHRVIGVTPRTYHRHIRLEASRRLLRRGRPSALVAYDLSFSDQSHFIRSFRKQFGMTPGDYLQAIQVARPTGTTATIAHA